MDAKDLRIGNLVSDNYSDEIIIYSINNKGINLYIEDDGNYPECAEQWLEPVYSFNEIKGIPLTEEWLLKFGFEKTYDGIFKTQYDMPCNFIGFDFSKTKDKYMEGFRYYGMYIKIDYIHQLQNLYFALTQTELVYEAK